MFLKLYQYESKYKAAANRTLGKSDSGANPTLWRAETKPVPMKPKLLIVCPFNCSPVGVPETQVGTPAE